MSSPITFSGFNNIDFGVVLNAIMQQERAPIAAIEAQRTTLQAQNAAFATLATRLSTLRDAASGLTQAETLSRITGSSSDDTAVGISTGESSITGRYEVVVSELARAQVTASSTIYESLETVVATSGVISIARFGEPPVDIPIAGATTLEELAEAINQDPNSPVNASIVQVTPGQYRLVLTGRSTGTANAFTLSFSTPLSGGQGLEFTDTDGNGTIGDSPEDQAQVASDAQLTINGIAVTSSSNQISDAIPGVTMTLKKKDPAAVVTIDVTKDEEASKAPVEEFANAYNALITFLNEQQQASSSGKPGIGRDPLVRALRDSLRSTIMGAQGSSGTFNRLAEVGVEFDATGKMKINATRLSVALSESPADVQQLFTDRFTAIEDLISAYTDAGGLVADVRERIDSQVARLGSRIDVLEQQLAIRRAALQREFIAADRAMSQLNSQGSSLTQLGGQYRLF